MSLLTKIARLQKVRQQIARLESIAAQAEAEIAELLNLGATTRPVGRPHTKFTPEQRAEVNRLVTVEKLTKREVARRTGLKYHQVLYLSDQ